MSDKHYTDQHLLDVAKAHVEAAVRTERESLALALFGDKERAWKPCAMKWWDRSRSEHPDYCGIIPLTPGIPSVPSGDT